MTVLATHRVTMAYVLVLTVASLIPVSMYRTITAPALATPHAMVPFTSYDQLHQWVLTMSCNAAGDCKKGISPMPAPVCDCFCFGATNAPGTAFALSAASGTSASPVPNHSETNAQVAGVDELDTVKNDGTYLYTVTNNSVAIVRAYPKVDARLLARISVNGSIQGIFIDGNKLVVISQHYLYYPYPCLGMAQPPLGTPTIGAVSFNYPIISNAETTSLWVFDLSDHSSPVLTTTLVVNGTLAGARLIGNYAYLVATQPVYGTDPIVLPENILNGRVLMVTPNEVYHSDVPDYAHSFTTILGIDVTQADPVPSSKTFLIGTSSTIYVSLHEIYLTQSVWSLSEETTIHRISIEGASVSYEATGTVPGHVLNQFSMDENNGYFRVATNNYGYTQTVDVQSKTTYMQMTQQTNLYVLDSSLHIVGRLEGLSPGEAFYAARFLGDRAYLVTFQRLDPLFVIGLKDPTQPRVLGQLNITGVSDYLQPYDETHLIGFGKSSTLVGWENAALFQGLKLTFFDVTDPSNPIDTSNYLIGDRGSESPALTDHRSVLFDHLLNLLVIPLEVAKAQPTTEQWAYNQIVWQGAYVFNVSPENGLVFRGGITHLPPGEVPSWENSNRFVNRALYIGNVLYTVSNNMIVMNSLSDLSDLGSVSLA